MKTRKFLFYLKFYVLFFLKGLFWLLAKIVYPLAYALRNVKIFREKILWYFYDDEDGYYGAQYWLDAKNITKLNFWTAYRWSALRNPAWNFQASLVANNGERVVKEARGVLIRDGEALDEEALEMSQLRYVDEDGKPTFNTGVILDLKRSIICYENRKIWFEVDGTLYLRKSTARPVLRKSIMFWIVGFIFLLKGRNVFNSNYELWIEKQFGIGRNINNENERYITKTKYNAVIIDY